MLQQLLLGKLLLKPHQRVCGDLLVREPDRSVDAFREDGAREAAARVFELAVYFARRGGPSGQVRKRRRDFASGTQAGPPGVENPRVVREEFFLPEWEADFGAVGAEGEDGGVYFLEGEEVALGARGVAFGGARFLWDGAEAAETLQVVWGKNVSVQLYHLLVWDRRQVHLCLHALETAPRARREVEIPPKFSTDPTSTRKQHLYERLGRVEHVRAYGSLDAQKFPRV
ncbi:hypothetical protein CVT26_005322 [Gymnopilus dilepis]|uniref:Uncharacterized protein n=1 Tax=Gymnopilus dilepis TaxID=231916 RepID=A0A409X4T8_9AGAR|nr:hypothetical protein CVT26_005322 [Gymnopilus dilepis]